MGQRNQLRALATLAIIDFLLFGAAWSLIAWPLSAALPWLSNVGVRLGVFAAAWTVCVRVAGVTPASLALGARRTADGWCFERDPRGSERWWTTLAGIVLVNEGSNNLVRFADGMPPPPIFGVAPSPLLAFALIALIGGSNIVAGLLVLRRSPVGARIGIGVALLEMSSLMAGPEAVGDWIRALVVARRAAQGRPADEGEVASMQAVLPTLALTVGAATIVWLLLVNRRLGRTGGG